MQAWLSIKRQTLLRLLCVRRGNGVWVESGRLEVTQYTESVSNGHLHQPHHAVHVPFRTTGEEFEICLLRSAKPVNIVIAIVVTKPPNYSLSPAQNYSSLQRRSVNQGTKGHPSAVASGGSRESAQRLAAPGSHW